MTCSTACLGYRARVSHLKYNCRNLPNGSDGHLIRCAVECVTITYDQLKAGTMPDGAKRLRGLPVAVAQPALAG
jgi:hypothetical protein